MTFQQFDSGAVRDTQEGKIKFDLITPTFKKDLAAMLTAKAAHYGDRNWEKGIPTARTFSSLLRHVEALGRGEWLDEESGYPHTVLAAANLMFIHEFHGTEFDTLHELVGPALRVQKDLRAGYEALAEELKVPDTINHGDPEPPFDTVWEDREGDRWFGMTSGEGWSLLGHDSQIGCPWVEIDKEYFPVVRVS